MWRFSKLVTGARCAGLPPWPFDISGEQPSPFRPQILFRNAALYGIHPSRAPTAQSRPCFGMFLDFGALRAPFKALIKSLALMKTVLSHHVVLTPFAPYFLASSTSRVHDEMRGMSLYGPVAARDPLASGPSKLSGV